MPGTLTVTTISDGSISTSATNLISGSAKVRVSFNSTPTITGSYNMSSVTKSSTGTYTITYGTAMSASSYTHVHGLLSDSNWGAIARSGEGGGGAAPLIKTTTQASMQTVAKAANNTADINDQGLLVFI